MILIVFLRQRAVSETPQLSLRYLIKVLMCLIYSNKTIRIIYQFGILTAANES